VRRAAFPSIAITSTLTSAAISLTQRMKQVWMLAAFKRLNTRAMVSCFGTGQIQLFRVTFGRVGQRLLARRKPIHWGWHPCQQQLPYFNRLAINKCYPGLMGSHVLVCHFQRVNTFLANQV
jgi:hypothetical protein